LSIRPANERARNDSAAGEAKIWLWAFLLTLFLHAFVLSLLAVLRPFDAKPVEAKEPEPIQLVFQKSPAATAAKKDSKDSKPRTFSELPPDRQDQAPEQADLLSNVNSRARDQKEGGTEGALPRMTGDSEIPQVAMRPSSQGQEAAPQAEPSPKGSKEGQAEEESHTPSLGGKKDLPASVDELSGEAKKQELRRGQEQAESDRRLAPSDPSKELLRNQGRAVPQLVHPDKGMQDIFQEEMHNPGGNTALFGDISLNTLEWPWAPWLQRFRRDFVRNWVAPYAYYLGLIDGYTVVELEIAPDGRMLRLDVLEEKGHESLSQNSVAAFKATAPFRPLPEGFPEPTLVLRIKLIYPPLHRR
jgi:outer membrane biosynthesis protein TonB